MNMTNDNEMNEFDREWQPGPVVEVDWWGGKFDADLDCSDPECDCDGEAEVADLELV